MGEPVKGRGLLFNLIFDGTGAKTRNLVTPGSFVNNMSG